MPNIIMCDQPSGGVDYLNLLLDNQLTSYEIKSEKVKDYAFYDASALTSVEFPGTLQSVGTNAFYGTAITSLHIYEVGTIGQYSAKLSSIKTIVIEKLTGNSPLAASAFRDMSELEKLDIGYAKRFGDGSGILVNSSNFTTIILRNTSVVPLGYVNVFNNSVFASGGTGGTIYIPKSLYDHLGDGTSNDYKAATNWSTVDGYGTITWAKIEGSAYDGYWADGTPITA